MCKRGVPLANAGILVDTEVSEVSCFHREQIYIKGHPTCVQFTEKDASTCRPGLVCKTSADSGTIGTLVTDLYNNRENIKYRHEDCGIG